MKFIFGAVDEAPDATLGLLYILIRFVVGSAIAEHPNSEGCAQKYDAVLAAYLSDTTAREQTIEEIRERIREICQEIKAISKRIEDAVKKDINEVITALMPLIEELKELGVAIYELPEYEELVESYAEAIGLMQETTFILEDKVATLEATSGELQNKVDALERNVQELEQQAQFTDKTMMELQAKSVRVQLNTKVTFPSNKVKVTVSWDKDDDADGYVFKVNGTVKQPTVTATGFTYVDETAQVGETYKFEVTPYVLYKGEQINGKTFKATVVPKVKLSKGVITSLKKGTQSFTVKWKKVSGASGYQVSYKTGKTTKKKTVNGGSKKSLKVKNLTSGKQYKVRVRAWKKVNGKKYYGKWSTVRKVTVK
jgi:prefoldin subunit 5